MNEQTAGDYLSKMLTLNLRNELAGRESAIRLEFQQQISNKSAEMFLQAPDVYIAAAMMS